MSPNVADWDQDLFYLINSAWTASVLDWLMSTLSRAGNFGAIWLVLLGVIAVFGKRTDRTVALAGLFALVLGHLASDVLKVLTLRPRPFASLPDVRLLVPHPNSFAFPSGHATSAFSAATGVVLAAKKSLKRVRLFGWGMLVLAAAISYSRVYVGVHYPTDVVAGVSLGIACGWIGAWCVAGGGSRLGDLTVRSRRARPRTDTGSTKPTQRVTRR
jgi:undecaprenyl-diphosphatase